MQCEIAGSAMFDSKAEAAAETFQDLEVFHGRVRLRSSMGHVSPAEYERANNQ